MHIYVRIYVVYIYNIYAHTYSSINYKMVLQKVLGDILHENSVIETYVYIHNLQRKPVLSDPDIKKPSGRTLSKLVVAVINKASSNFENM